MLKLCKLALSVGFSLSLLTCFAMLLGGAQPPTLNDETVRKHGSDSTLMIGDYILLYGQPLGLDAFDGERTSPYSGTGDALLDVRWRTLEVDVCATDFSPYSTVLYTNAYQWHDTPRWRGFRLP